MSVPRIKICGITSLADARYAAGAGAHYLGFIQVSGTPRFVDPDFVRDMLEWIHGADAVGVFRDASADDVNRVAEHVGFSTVQLHGDESPELCRQIERPVVKAIHVGREGTAGGATAEELTRAADRYVGAASHLLLDTASGTASGGTGRSFDWSIVPELPMPFFLAGGLTPDNVADAVRQVRPFAVDTSSGVEESPGVKDFERIDAFVAAVEAA